MIGRLATDSPDPAWQKLFETSASAQVHFMKWFGRQAITEVRKEARRQYRGDTPHDRRPVPCVCIDNGMEFRSFAQAGKWAGVNGTLISDCCYGVRGSVAGHHFALKESEG